MNPVIPLAVINFLVELTVPLKMEAAGSSKVFVRNTIRGAQIPVARSPVL